MNTRSLRYAAVALGFAVALLWWIFWACYFLRGWTAMPLGLTVGGALYAGAFCCGFAAAGARRK